MTMYSQGFNNGVPSQTQDCGFASHYQGRRGGGLIGLIVLALIVAIFF